MVVYVFMNYPGLNKQYHKLTTYGNRGMDLEELINSTNKYYLEKDIAIIYKKPTPIGISKIDYEKNKISGFFKEQSTLDYNGIYKGYYIDFDAKVTKNKTSFPISNIHNHQIEHIKRVIRHKGIAFLIIEMNSKYFLLPGTKLLEFLNKTSRKSIPYDYIVDNSYEIKLGYNPDLDYIKAVDKLLGGFIYGKEE